MYTDLGGECYIITINNSLGFFWERLTNEGFGRIGTGFLGGGREWTFGRSERKGG